MQTVGSYGRVAGEDGAESFAEFRIVTISLSVKCVQRFRIGNAVLYDKITHHSTSSFGKKADDFVLPSFEIPELRRDSQGCHFAIR